MSSSRGLKDGREAAPAYIHVRRCGPTPVTPPPPPTPVPLLDVPLPDPVLCQDNCLNSHLRNAMSSGNWLQQVLVEDDGEGRPAAIEVYGLQDTRKVPGKTIYVKYVLSQVKNQKFDWIE